MAASVAPPVATSAIVDGSVKLTGKPVAAAMFSAASWFLSKTKPTPCLMGSGKTLVIAEALLPKNYKEGPTIGSALAELEM